MQEMQMKSYQLMHLVLIQEDDSDNKETPEEELSEEEKRRKLKDAIMNDLLDEFDDDIDRIKSQAVPKSVKYSVFSFGFLVIFLIMWGTISEIDTTISASGKITTIVPNVEVQSNYNSVVKEIYMLKKDKVLKKMSRC